MIFSLVFYAWGESLVVLLLILSALVDYSCGLLIDEGFKKIGLISSLIFNIGVLLFFKYSYFLIDNINSALQILNFNFSLKNIDVSLPIGISFFTFQTMSYTIDVYRGNVKANKRFLDFATYVALFPQLIAGPIVRYAEIQFQLKERKRNIHQISAGVERFIIGLSKKMIIANNCGYLADGIFSLAESDLSTGMAWLGIIGYTFQIYFDFSGYSDMAIGLGKLFGFDFPENFNFPYISKSIREFWRRWHITLSTWFRDYLYISLGGNKNGSLKTYSNLIIVFFITGLWHGANWTFIIWGLFHGFFMILERVKLQSYLNKIPKVFSHGYVILVVLISWVIFRSHNLTQVYYYLDSMFSYTGSINTEYLSHLMTWETNLALIFAFIFSIPKEKSLRLIKENILKDKKYYLITRTLILACLFTICVFYVANESYNPFIYFRF
ncbi:MBOAT family O-acyltransferase [Winogradskyella poriferorum]|uniref:MBOAT family O-acyltransferase n=1 Tax=Winogradskyella poriferorum TaxID=307627 RepID=UPI003D64DE2B